MVISLAHLFTVFLLLNCGNATFMSLCTNVEKMYSFWFVLDCTHDFLFNDIVLLEHDIIGADDYVTSFSQSPPLYVRKQMLLHLNAIMTDDEYGNDVFSFKFVLNSTCNSKGIFETTFSNSKESNCEHTSFGPHPLVIMSHIDRDTTAIDSEEAY